LRPPAASRIQRFVTRFITVVSALIGHELPYRASKGLRNICAISIPMNGRSPGSGTCTASARRISLAMIRA
jgi:hypothetical protein